MQEGYLFIETILSICRLRIISDNHGAYFNINRKQPFFYNVNTL